MEFPFAAELVNSRGRDKVHVHEIRFDPVDPPKAVITPPVGGSRVLVYLDRIRAV